MPGERWTRYSRTFVILTRAVTIAELRHCDRPFLERERDYWLHSIPDFDSIARFWGYENTQNQQQITQVR